MPKVIFNPVSEEGLQLYPSSTEFFSHWQLNSGILSPNTISNSLNLGATATASATVHLAGTVGENSFINTGNVGIGIASPSEKLHIYRAGTNTLETKIENDAGSLRLIQNYTGDAYIYESAAKSLSLGTNNSTRLTILSGGNVGIGTTSPSAHLQVTNTSDTIGQIIKGYSSQTANLQEWQNSSGTVLGSVSYAGALTLAPTTFTDRSDSFATSSYNSISTNVNPSSSNTSGHSYQGLTSNITYTSNFTDNPIYVQGTVSYANSYGSGTVYELDGLVNQARHYGSGTVGHAYGSINYSKNQSTGTITHADAVYGRVLNYNTGTITEGSAFYVADGYNPSGTFTTQFGLYVGSLTAASTNYAIYTNAGLNQLGDQLKIVGSIDRQQLIIKANATQTTNLTEWQNSSGTLLASISPTGSDTATLGSELITNGNFDSDLSGWTASDWTWSSGTAAHSAGTTTPITQDINLTNGTTYQVTVTAARTAGTLTLTFGSLEGSYPISSSNTYTQTFKATATAPTTLTFTPNSTFAGSIDGVSVKAITGSVSPDFSLFNTDGSFGFEARSGGAGLSNSYLGYRSGYYNTTGTQNSAQGYASLYNNTTGYANSAQGSYALYSNTTGYNNSAQGSSALYYNTIGYQNSAIGAYAGRYIADGSTANQTSLNSLYLGYSTKALANGDTNEIVIGYNAIGLGSNSVVLGNTAITKTLLRGDVSTNGDMKAATYHVGAVAGVDGTFTSADIPSKTITVTKGLITSII